MEAAELNWLGPLAAADPEEPEYDYADCCRAVLEPGEEFEVVVGEAAVTCVVPAVPTEEESRKLLAEPSESNSGLLSTLRYCSFDVDLSEDEQFDPALLGWQCVVFGDLELGLAPVSYGGDPDRLEFSDSEPKGDALFNWVAGSFRQFDSFDELFKALLASQV